MVAEHTPGPWMVPHFATDADCNCQYVLSDNQHGMGAIATVHHDGETDGRHNEPMEIAQANARLIAAAPELLTALIWAEAAIAPFSKDPQEKSGINMARAAIAKATGK